MCFRISTGLKGFPSERRIYQSTLVGQTNCYHDVSQKVERIKGLFARTVFTFIWAAANGDEANAGSRGAFPFSALFARTASGRKCRRRLFSLISLDSLKPPTLRPPFAAIEFGILNFLRHVVLQISKDRRARSPRTCPQKRVTIKMVGFFFFRYRSNHHDQAL